MIGVVFMSLIEKIVSKLGIESQTAVVIISIATILILGFLMTRITKKLKLPNVTAYIIIGILLVPIWKIIPAHISGIIPDKVIGGMDFLSDIALAFIAFSAGEFLKLNELKKSGKNIIIITLFESLCAFFLVLIICHFALGIQFSFSLVLAALSSATAPASTIMTIKQTKAKGEYVNTLLEVIALDNIVALLLYSVSISVCLAINNDGNGITFASIGFPIIKTICTIILGFGFGFLLKLLLPQKRSTDNRLIIVIAMLFTFCGICALLDQSPLLGCMIMGMVYINTTGDNKLFNQLNYFTPPILLLFFVMSGMRFNLKAFTNLTKLGYVPLFVVAIVYFIIRIIGKYAGSYIGGTIAKQDKSINNYLGLALIPQAGVAIGLAYMGARILGNEPGELGDSLQTIILASSVLYEIVGPGLAKLGLYLSKSYSTNTIKPEDDKNEVQPLHNKEIHNDYEDAYNEAADEYIDNTRIKKD